VKQSVANSHLIADVYIFILLTKASNKKSVISLDGFEK
jgi:hypothetical protein